MFSALPVMLPYLMAVNPFMLMEGSTAADITTFTTWATSLVQWMITTFGSVLTFMLANPICFVSLIMVLIIATIGTLRHIIGG